jgi:hypothetical protein
MKAAERDTSVSALVAQFLTELAAGETEDRATEDHDALRIFGRLESEFY